MRIRLQSTDNGARLKRRLLTLAVAVGVLSTGAGIALLFRKPASAPHAGGGSSVATVFQPAIVASDSAAPQAPSVAVRAPISAPLSGADTDQPTRLLAIAPAAPAESPKEASVTAQEPPQVADESAPAEDQVAASPNERSAEAAAASDETPAPSSQIVRLPPATPASEGLQQTSMRLLEERYPTTSPALETVIVHHKVRDGDTLADIARKYLGSPDAADEIFNANRDLLRDPALLPIGVTLRVPTKR